MFEFILGAIVGTVVGWNVLPQPAWVAALYTRWFEKTETTTEE